MLESFASEEEIDAMMKGMEQLVHDFDPSSTASIFSTKNQVSLISFLKKKKGPSFPLTFQVGVFIYLY